MSFKIEKIKWSWAAPVQDKSVYRDDEYVVSKTKEEALAAIDFLLNKPSGLTYTITVLRDGEYYTYWRHSMPCLGGLVKYKDSHGERYFMNPYFPRDISVAFPEGEITFIGCHRQTSKDVPKQSALFEFMFSEESPWVSCFGSKDSIIWRDNYFVLTDMKTDPTVFYSLMRLGGFAYGGVYAGKSVYTQKKWNPKAEILATKYTIADPRRLAGQKPIRISGGTWAEGYGYTRPYNESIFKTKLPHKLSEFAKAGSYPNAPHDNTYFLNTMKDKFGVDFSKGVLVEEKNEKALIEAWDYFKEEAKNLTDEGEKAA